MDNAPRPAPVRVKGDSYYHVQSFSIGDAAQKCVNLDNRSENAIVSRTTVWILFLGQLVLLVVAGWHNRFRLNADAIAYLRLAQYYAQGQTDLMISGYWGPLLSWLMAPWIVCGISPLIAGRMVMAFSAMVFFLASYYLLRQTGFSLREQIAGAAIAAITGVVWSVTEITPDLLLAGLVAWAWGSMAAGDWSTRKGAGWITGLGWGAAYLCKGVGFPMAIGVSTLMGVYRWARLKEPAGVLGRQWLKSMLVFFLVAGPWITVISAKYHRLTFSTSAAIGHAIEGPADVDRYHPSAIRFHQPAPGRLTAWEDPSEMPYQYWRPWEKASYAQHQLRLMGRNLLVALYRLSELDWAGLGVLCLIMVSGMGLWTGFKRGFSLNSPGSPREREVGARWTGAAIPILCLVATYMPVHATEARFYYPAFLMLIVLSLGTVAFLASRFPQASRFKSLGLILVSVCFAGPAVMQLPAVVRGLTDPAVACAWQLAQRLQQAGIEGAIAGSGMVAGQRTGLYAAYLLERPWHGDERDPTPESFQNSGALILVLNRNHPAVSRFVAASDIRDLDNQLFETPEQAARFPLKVFARTQTAETTPSVR
jgi:hypothetical protein